MQRLGAACLAALAEFTTDVVMLTDADGVIVWASPSARDVLGFVPETLVGTRPRDLVVADDQEAFRSLIDRALGAPGATFSSEFRCRHRDGSVRWTHGIGRNLLTQPRVGAIFVCFRDVTLARDVEAALHASETRYRQLFDQATDVVFEADAAGYFRFVNPAAIRTFGYDEAEILGHRFTEFVRADHRQRVVDHYRAQIDAGAASSYIEFPAIAKNGDEIWVGQNAWMVTDADGRFCGMRAVTRDITQKRLVVDALREAEAKYRSLVEHSLFGVYIVQGEKLVYVNPTGAALLGYTTDELLTMQSMLHLLSPADRDQVFQQFERLKRGLPTAHFVVRATHKNGTSVLGELNCSNAEYEGQPAIIATVMDISDRLRLEEQLRHAQKMEAVGRLAGGIAHDFNNLLTAIRGNAELLYARIKDDPVLAAEVDEVLQASDRAASLTRQLLAFSRKQEVRAVTLNLNDVVDNVARLARRVIGAEVELEIRAGTTLRPVVADPAQMEQVLLNLLLNARDALPEGGRIRIRTANVTLHEASPESERTGLAPGRYVLLQVSDDGVGMDQATQARIFEPFFTTKEPGRGTGLGLAMVYGNVRQMGGAVTVKSARHCGATFNVHIPVATLVGSRPAKHSSRQEA